MSLTKQFETFTRPFFFKAFGNIMGKGDNACNKRFSSDPTMYSNRPWEKDKYKYFHLPFILRFAYILSLDESTKFCREERVSTP